MGEGLKRALAAAKATRAKATRVKPKHPDSIRLDALQRQILTGTIAWDGRGNFPSNNPYRDGIGLINGDLRSALDRLEGALFPFTNDKICGHKMTEQCDCMELNGIIASGSAR